MIAPRPSRGLVGLLVSLLAVPVGCQSDPNSPAVTSSEASAAFHDAAAETGLLFQHDNGMTGVRYMPEMVGAGTALFDYDRDGDLDVFLVQGRRLGPEVSPDAVDGPCHRLYRNDLEIGSDGKRHLRFTDVSAAAGLTFCDYGMGVAAGDYDNDGWIDLYVTCLGANRLLRNTGRSGFEDVTAQAGLADEPGWSSSAAWVDYDRDGRLDLVVCRYLLWDFAVHQNCASPGGQVDYCGPNAFQPARSRLFHNVGNGRFEDVSRASRISSLAGAALGVVCADLDEDGWPDFFITNDGMSNHLWMNHKDGTFHEEASVRGCAMNSEGKPEANMGVIAADFRNVGRIDLFITHLKGEHATYYENLNDGIFADVTAKLALDGTTRPFTGFGTGALDYDNDGWLDLFATNGEVRTNDAQAQAGIKVPMRQRSMLFHNQGGDSIRFEEIRAGKFLQVEDVGRGAAFGDLDQDGDLDIVVTNKAGPTRLLINDVGQDQHWLGLRLVDGPADARRDVLGAIVRVERPNAPILQRRSATDGSYLSSSDPRTLFGLGRYSQVTRVVVKWPDGREEVWRDLAVDQYHDLARGSGVAEDSASSGPSRGRN